MRGMKRTRTVGTTRKAGASLDCMTEAQRNVLDEIDAYFYGREFNLVDLASATKRSVQSFGVSIRALCRMGLLEQTYRSPSSRKPNEYRRIKS